jgi:hypothetical protein
MRSLAHPTQSCSIQMHCRDISGQRVFLRAHGSAGLLAFSSCEGLWTNVRPAFEMQFALQLLFCRPRSL